MFCVLEPDKGFAAFVPSVDEPADRSGLTDPQEVLAGRVGRSASWLAKVERGERVMDSISGLLAMANVLTVEPGDLIGGDLAAAQRRRSTRAAAGHIRCPSGDPFPLPVRAP